MAKGKQKGEFENEGNEVFNEMVNGGGGKDAGKDGGAKQDEPTLIIESKSLDTSRPDPIEGAKKKNPDATKTKHQPDAIDIELKKEFERVGEKSDGRNGEKKKKKTVTKFPNRREQSWRQGEKLPKVVRELMGVYPKIFRAYESGESFIAQERGLVRIASIRRTEEGLVVVLHPNTYNSRTRAITVHAQDIEKTIQFQSDEIDAMARDQRLDSNDKMDKGGADEGTEIVKKTGKSLVVVPGSTVERGEQGKEDNISDEKGEISEQIKYEDFDGVFGKVRDVYDAYVQSQEGEDRQRRLREHFAKKMNAVHAASGMQGESSDDWKVLADALPEVLEHSVFAKIREAFIEACNADDACREKYGKGGIDAETPDVPASVAAEVDKELHEPVVESELGSARRHVEVEGSDSKENHKIQELQERLSVLAERRVQLERDLEEGRKQRSGFMEKLMSIVLKKKGQTVDLKNFDQEMKLKEERLAEIKKQEAEIRRQLDLEENEPFIGDGNILEKPDQGAAMIEDVQVENGERGLLGLEMLSQELDSATQEMDALIRARNKKERERKLRSVLMGIGIVLGSMTAERLAMEEIVERPIPIGHEDVIVNAATHGGNVDVSHTAPSGGGAEASDAASVHTPKAPAVEPGANSDVSVGETPSSVEHASEAPTAPAEGSVPTAPDSSVSETGAADASSATAQPEVVAADAASHAAPDAASEAVQSYGVKALSGQELVVNQGSSDQSSIIKYLVSHGMSEPQAGAEAHRLWENFLARNPNDFYLNSDHYITYPDARISFGSNGEIMSVVDSKRAVIGTLMRDVSGGTPLSSVRDIAYENLSRSMRERMNDILENARSMDINVQPEGKSTLRIIVEVARIYADKKGFTS